jgi:dethiobiotin synthetase
MSHSSHESRVTGHGFFITGTDTGVGKTLVACALLKACASRGVRAVGMKPVAAGAAEDGGRLLNDDVGALKAASSVIAADDLVNPYCFAPAVAPHIAAAEAGVTIDIERIRRACLALAAAADRVIVEGAGGFRVPLGPRTDTAQLAAALGLPVLLVVGMRLGCINHALLTAEAVRASGLALAGWIANHIDPRMARADENVAALEERLAAPLIARVAYSASPEAARVASLLEVERLALSGR